MLLRRSSFISPNLEHSRPKLKRSNFDVYDYIPSNQASSIREVKNSVITYLNFFERIISLRDEKKLVFATRQNVVERRVPGKRRGQLFPRSGKVYDCPSRSRIAPGVKFSCEKQVSQEYVISLCETAGRRHLRPHRCSISLFFFLLSSTSLFSYRQTSFC